MARWLHLVSVYAPSAKTMSHVTSPPVSSGQLGGSYDAFGLGMTEPLLSSVLWLQATVCVHCFSWNEEEQSVTWPVGSHGQRQEKKKLKKEEIKSKSTAEHSQLSASVSDIMEVNDKVWILHEFLQRDDGQLVYLQTPPPSSSPLSAAVLQLYFRANYVEREGMD